MIDALVISNVLLWLLVLVLAGVVVALVRQVGLLHERLGPVGALAVESGPAPGQPAPELELEDWQGQRVRLGGVDATGRSTLLFFLSPTCPVCETLLPTLRSVAVAEGDWLRVVLASDGPRAEHLDFVKAQGLARRSYVLSAELGLRYRVGRLPYAVLIDENGVVRAAGLVNTREHLESLFEAKERGVASLQEHLGARSLAGGSEGGA